MGDLFRTRSFRCCMACSTVATRPIRDSGICYGLFPGSSASEVGQDARSAVDDSGAAGAQGRSVHAGPLLSVVSTRHANESSHGAISVGRMGAAPAKTGLERPSARRTVVPRAHLARVPAAPAPARRDFRQGFQKRGQGVQPSHLVWAVRRFTGAGAQHGGRLTNDPRVGSPILSWARRRNRNRRVIPTVISHDHFLRSGAPTDPWHPDTDLRHSLAARRGRSFLV